MIIMELFGLEIQMNPALLITIIIVVLLSLAGVISIFYHFRKRVWYAFVSATLSILISLFIPLIADQLLWTQIASENVLLTKIIYAFETGFLVLFLKRIFGWGFAISNKSIQDQR